MAARDADGAEPLVIPEGGERAPAGPAWSKAKRRKVVEFLLQDAMQRHLYFGKPKAITRGYLSGRMHKWGVPPPVNLTEHEFQSALKTIKARLDGKELTEEYCGELSGGDEARPPIDLAECQHELQELGLETTGGHPIPGNVTRIVRAYLKVEGRSTAELRAWVPGARATAKHGRWTAMLDELVKVLDGIDEAGRS